MLRDRRGPPVLRWRLVRSQWVLRKLRLVRRPRAWLRQWFPRGPRLAERPRVLRRRLTRRPRVVRGRRLAERPRVLRRRLVRSPCVLRGRWLADRPRILRTRFVPGRLRTSRTGKRAHRPAVRGALGSGAEGGQRT